MQPFPTTDQELDELASALLRSVPRRDRRGRMAGDPSDIADVSVVASLRDLAARRHPGTPLLRVCAGDDEKLAAEGQVAGGPTTVAVIADDSPMLLEAVLAVLAGLGFQPDTGQADGCRQPAKLCAGLLVRRGDAGEYLGCAGVTGRLGADQGGADQGGADQGGADQGGAGQGGADQGGADQGGAGQGNGASDQVAAGRWIMERWLHLVLPHVGDPAVLGELRNQLLRVLELLAMATRDQAAMRRQVADVAEAISVETRGAAGRGVENPGAGDSSEQGERTEIATLLGWMLRENFSFLGTVVYRIEPGRRGGDRLAAGLRHGLLLEAGLDLPELHELPVAEDSAVSALAVSKARAPVPVGAHGWFDDVVVPLSDNGRPAGALRVIGVFPDAVDSVPVREMPVVRRRVPRLRASVVDRDQHQDLDGYLYSYPRPELLACRTHDLVNATQRLLDGIRQTRFGLALHADPLGRYVSVTVCLPAARLSPERRGPLFDVLRRHLGGTDVELVATVPLGRGDLVRLHLLVWSGDAAAADVDAVAAEVEAVTTVWDEEFRQALRWRFGDNRANTIHLRYRCALTEVYRRQCRPAEAVDDVLRMEQLEEPRQPALRLFRAGRDGAELRFKVYQYAEPMAMSDLVAAMHCLDVRVLDARCFEIHRSDESIHVVDAGLQLPSAALAVELIRPHLESAFDALIRGRTEADRLNALVVLAGLTWRQVRLLRAIAAPAGVTSAGQDSPIVVAALLANPEVAALLVELIESRQPRVAGRFPTTGQACGNVGRSHQTAKVVAVTRRRIAAVSCGEAGQALRGLLSAASS